jgi:hypothetical protein
VMIMTYNLSSLLWILGLDLRGHKSVHPPISNS